jgi:DNA repair protein RadC
MKTMSVPVGFSDSGYSVRELVVTSRPLRDHLGLQVRVPTLELSDPKMAAATLGPLVADQAVEVFGIGCLSARQQLVAWHLLSRGTRTSAPVSIADVFVPAFLTPATTSLIVVHNHPSGDPTPSTDDARLTARLCSAAHILGVGLLDHLIVGGDRRYFSFREAGGPWMKDMHPTADDDGSDTGHHVP